MQEYREVLNKICKDFGVDSDVMAAIITVESNWRPWAVRHEPTFKLNNTPYLTFAKENGITGETERTLQRCSWGLGQVLGATARHMGFAGPLNSLCDVTTGLIWSVKFYSRLHKRYDTVADRIAAYNAGSATFDGFQKYINQGYVDKVSKHLPPGKLRV